MPESAKMKLAKSGSSISKGRQIHCYDYVNRPYEQVRSALSNDAPTVFQSATKAAANRARSIASELRLEIAGIGIETDIRVSVKNIEAKERKARSGPATRLELEWEATKMAHLFPVMKADLFIYPITATETQLDFNGLYQPPLGPLGKAMNAMIGRRIAQACVHRFISDVAEYLRTNLGRPIAGE
ncbi:MAG: hypothetical protein JO170_14450 [Verrucomicrobia bacterium]|nr:hypothetical protein [Verrucomicrobiota bacterium]